MHSTKRYNIIKYIVQVFKYYESIVYYLLNLLHL